MPEQLLDLGGMTLAWLNGGEFKMDGGAMFGVVPKLLWSKQIPADADNLIAMRAAPLLVRSGGVNILIDTGLGNKLTEKQQRIYRISRPWQIDEDLAQYGLTPGDIDMVILTHCDFDHAGGVVRVNDRGEVALTFPNARHLVHTLEWRAVEHPTSRSIHSYFTENFIGLAQSGGLELINADREVTPGVRVCHTGGHTAGHLLVEMTGNSARAVHLADLMPTHAHANPLWTMAYDDYPLEVIAKKETLIPFYHLGGYIFTFYHDTTMGAGCLDGNMTMTRCV